MAQLNPFLAWRPAPEHVLEVVCPPYDVISVAEARALADGKTQSFLRVVRPEVDLPDGIDEHDDAVYAQGARNLIEFCDGGILHRDLINRMACILWIRGLEGLYFSASWPCRPLAYRGHE